MAMNLIQFQPGLTMVEFFERYGTEANCRRALYEARWPKGFRYPACGDRRRSTFRRERQTYYQCRTCQHQTTLIAGKLFAATKLPLRAWFIAIYALTKTKTNMAALKRFLTAAGWSTDASVGGVLPNCVATQTQDHAHHDRMWRSPPIGGFCTTGRRVSGWRPRGGKKRNGGKSGRRSENKQPFLIAVVTDENLEHPTFAVIEPIRAFDDTAMIDWGGRRLAPQAEVFTDGLGCFRRFADADHPHTILQTAGGRAATQVAGAKWVNILLSNVKRAISGRYHAIRQAKYARRYLAEAAYRFNRRFRLRELVPRLLHAMLLCKPCSEASLRLACNFLC
jgi:hypothetical protein